jgi:hypothetical protein
MKKLAYLIALISTFAFQSQSLAGIEAAYYEVPTSQAHLKSAAQFKIRKLSVQQNTEGQTLIKYQVPEELTGLDNTVEFSGSLTADGGTLTSDHGVLNCLANTNKMMCSVSYQKLDFSSDLAKDLLAKKFQGEDLVNRLKIQEKFSTDPIGIIHIIYQKY